MQSILAAHFRVLHVGRCSLIAFLLMAGCATVSEPMVPFTAETAIDASTSIRIYGNQGKRRTGIRLAKKEMYTIVATGTIRLRESGGKISPAGPRFLKSIGGRPLVAVFGSGFGLSGAGGVTGATFVAEASGELHLGVLDSYRDDNSGFFDVTVFVWKRDDWVEISSTLNLLRAANVNHPGIADAANLADRMQRVAALESKAAAEMKAAEAELKRIQVQGGVAETPSQAKALEQRLATLGDTLAALERMKRELGIERQKREQLSQQLAERERLEQELRGQLNAGMKSPPVLLITSPKPDTRTEAAMVRLVGAVQDDAGLKEVGVFVNGRRIARDTDRGLRITRGAAVRRQEFNVRIPLAKGANVIRVRAIDGDGLTAEHRITIIHESRRGNLWAVVVGIDAYPRVRPLQYAVADARSFHSVLVQQNNVPPENIFLLLNKQATLQNLRSTLGTKIKSRAGANDMVVIYFAGHGATERDSMSPDGDGLEKYLLPYDADPNDLYATAMPMREIAHILNRIRSERLVFIADACYSGASGGRTVGIGDLRATLSDRYLDRLAGGKGKVIITASNANEVSAETPALGHGVFTYYLVQGLRGPADTDRDGLITVDEAYRYVSEKVPANTRQEQHPVKKGTVEGQLVLSIVR